MPHSHHSHSGQFCRHSRDTLEEIVVEAIRQGFQLFGLSEHAPRWRVEDLYPEESELSPSELLMTFQAFLIEAQRLREAYQHQINILIGLETEFITPLDLTRTSALILDHPEIDYLVGSVHHVNGTPIDLDRPTWLQAVQNAERSEMGSTTNPSPSGRPISAQSHFDALGSRQDSNPDLNLLRPFLLAYFDAQYKVITTHQPEVIGHIDLCLLYTPDISLSSSELGEVWEKVERNVRYVVDYGGLFEANAAAIRKGWTTSYPSPDVMKLILSLGGKVCLSDDSHGVSYIGLNYMRMKDYLASMGVNGIWYLVSSAHKQIGDMTVSVRGRVVARRMDGDWRIHPFWATMAAAQSR